MKKIVFLTMLFSMINLFANMQDNKKSQEIDEIEMLVNKLLNEDTSIVKQKKIYKEATVQKRDQYYIQMFVYTKLKPKKLIKQIRKKGYEYITTKAYRHGREVNLLLVGPYKNRALALRNLKILRGIEKDAFIYKIK